MPKHAAFSAGSQPGATPRCARRNAGGYLAATQLIDACATTLAASSLAGEQAAAAERAAQEAADEAAIAHVRAMREAHPAADLNRAAPCGSCPSLGIPEFRKPSLSERACFLPLIERQSPFLPSPDRR
jgi:hypothetical protein